jgi:iron(III) transport system permease protein
MASAALAGAPRGAAERLLLTGIVAIVTVVALWPLARLVAEAIAPGGRFDLVVLERVLNSRVTERAFWRTLDTSVLGTIVSVVLGAAFALLVALTDIRAKAALSFLFIMPLVIPPQITALAWINLLSSSSPLLAPLGLAPAPGGEHPMFGRWGIVFLFGLEHAPLVFLALRAGLRAMPGELIEAARAAGAGRGRILRTIVLPLMAPALGAGAVLAFVASVGNFGTPALLGIPVGFDTLVTLLYQRLAGFGPRVLSEAAVLSLLIGILAVAATLVQGRLVARGDYRVITVGAASLSLPLGRLRAPLEIALWIVLFLLVVMPFAALVAASLVPSIGVELTAATITFNHYLSALFLQAATVRAFTNSFVLSAAAALGLVILAVPLAYFLIWRPGRLPRAIAAFVEVPYAIPGIVLAIAMILTFIHPLPVIGVSIYATVWIILAAYLARFFALALRPILSGFRQIDRALDEAAAAAGAGVFRRMRNVALPLVGPTAAAGAILVFMTALNELTVSALLWSRGTETLGVIVFSLQEGGDSPLAAAVSVVSIVAVLALMGFASLFARRLPPGVLPWGR